MDIRTATLADLGRFVASRTGNTTAAAIARSSAPQVRYDAVVYNVLLTATDRTQFSTAELLDLAGRIADPARRHRATEAIETE